MGNLAPVDLAILIIYVVGILAYGIWKARGVKTSEDFLVAGRNVGLFVLIGTLVMTEFNTATVMAWAGIGYGAGLFSIWVPCIFLVGFAFYAAFVAKKWKRVNAVSTAEMFGQRYSKGMQLFASVLSRKFVCICSRARESSGILGGGWKPRGQTSIEDDAPEVSRLQLQSRRRIASQMCKPMHKTFDRAQGRGRTRVWVAACAIAVLSSCHGWWPRKVSPVART